MSVSHSARLANHLPCRRTRVMEMASSYWPVSSETVADPISSRIMGSFAFSMNLARMPSSPSPRSSLVPQLACRARSEAGVSPRRTSTSNRAATASGESKHAAEEQRGAFCSILLLLVAIELLAKSVRRSGNDYDLERFQRSRGR